MRSSLRAAAWPAHRRPDGVPALWPPPHGRCPRRPRGL